MGIVKKGFDMGMVKDTVLTCRETLIEMVLAGYSKERCVAEMIERYIVTKEWVEEEYDSLLSDW